MYALAYGQQRQYFTRVCSIGVVLEGLWCYHLSLDMALLVLVLVLVVDPALFVTSSLRYHPPPLVLYR
jgi:hypothetical protein